MSNSTGITQWNPYPAYKDSGVEWLGQVPEGWEVKRLRYLSRINPTRSEMLLQPESLVSFAPMDAVGEYGGMLCQEKALDEIGSGYTYFIDGDVLVAKITPCFENGKGALAECLTNGIGFGSTEFHVVRSLRELSPQFLFYFTISYLFRKLGEAYMYGAGGQKRIPDAYIKNLFFPTPSLVEQQAIAAFLDHECARIDALIEKKRRLLELLEEKRRAVITKAVTRGLDPDVPMKDSGVVWLGQVPEGWEAWKLAHAFSYIGSGTTPKSDNPTYYGGDIPWVTTSELREGVITGTKNYITVEALASHSSLKTYPKGTLLIAMYGATIGRMGILAIDATCNQACCAITGDLALFTKFLYYWFQAMRDVLISFASGGGQPNLSQEFIRSVIVPAPPIIEQQAIAEYLDAATDSIDAQRKAHEKSIALLQEYRASLITHAVTGKLDVREYAPQQ